MARDLQRSIGVCFGFELLLGNEKVFQDLSYSKGHVEVGRGREAEAPQRQGVLAGV